MSGPPTENSNNPTPRSSGTSRNSPPPPPTASQVDDSTGIRRRANRRANTPNNNDEEEEGRRQLARMRSGNQGLEEDEDSNRPAGKPTTVVQSVLEENTSGSQAGDNASSSGGGGDGEGEGEGEGDKKLSEEERNKKKTWTAQEELILQKWAEVAKSYSWMHNRAFYNYRWQNFWFSIPVIILSNLTGIANFAQSSIPDESSYKKLLPLVIGGVNITAGIITTVYQFLKVSELLEAHRTAHIGYQKFARDIETELMQIRTLRSRDGRDFLEIQHKEFDRLIETSPIIPRKILAEFSDKFGTNKRCHGGTDEYVVNSKCQRLSNVCYNGLTCVFGCCCRRTINTCCNKANSPKTVGGQNQGPGQKRRQGDPNSPLHYSDEDDLSVDDAMSQLSRGGKPSLESKCSKRANCQCNKCQPFCRPEINNISRIEICTITEDDEENKNYDSSKLSKFSDLPPTSQEQNLYDASGNIRIAQPIASSPTNKDRNQHEGTDDEDEENAHHRNSRRQSKGFARGREEAHRRQIEELEQEQRQLMETAAAIRNSTQFQLSILGERQQKEQETAEAQLKESMATSVFQRALDYNRQEEEIKKREEDDNERRRKIESGMIDLQTEITKEESQTLHEKHPPLPPSPFLAFASKQGPPQKPAEAETNNRENVETISDMSGNVQLNVTDISGNDNETVQGDDTSVSESG